LSWCGTASNDRGATRADDRNTTHANARGTARADAAGTVNTPRAHDSICVVRIDGHYRDERNDCQRS